MEKTLSVIVPVYNTENYLRRALDSILGQTFAVYEVICVDDGSTDGSLQILNEYAQRDKRIKVLHKENGGLVSARKAGIVEARGEYVAYVDPDDFIQSMMYKEMMELAVMYDADLVTSGFIRDYGNSLTINNEKIRAGIYEGKQLETFILQFLIDKTSFYRTGISPSVCNKIFRTDKLKSLQMKIDNRISVGEDDAVVYPYLFRSNRVVISGKSYYHYCLRESGSVIAVKKEGDLEGIYALFQYLEKEFQAAEKPGLDLMKQFSLLKMYFLMLRVPFQALRYEREVLYPFGKIKKEEKILIYGAGKFGVEMKTYLEAQGFTVVAWADKSADRPGIIRPKDIQNIKFDHIVIAVLVADVVQHIQKDLKELGVPEQKILFADAKMIGKEER